MKKEAMFVLSSLRKEAIGDLNGINWMEVLNIANKHKVLPIIYEDVVNNAPREFSQVCKNQLRKATDKQKQLWSIYLKILDEAAKQNVKIVLPKGFPIAHLLYGSIELRPSADIDILVKDDDVLKICKILGNLGCFHRHNGRIEDIVKQFNSNEFDNFYELKFIKFTQNETLWIEVKKGTDAIPEKHILEFIDTAVRMKINGRDVWRLDDEHLFIHLCANAHKDTEGHEGICSNVFRLRNFYDMYLFLKRMAENLDWLKVKRCADKIEVTHKVKWALQCLNVLFPDIQHDPTFINCMKLFEGKCTYEYWGNQNGEAVNWTMPFVERLMDNEKAREDYYQKIEKRRWSPCNVNFQTARLQKRKWDWEEIKKGTGLEHCVMERGAQYFLCLRSKKVAMEKLLDCNRLYYSLVEGKNDNSCDIDAIGKPFFSVCLYSVHNEVRMIKDKFDMWSVNNATYSNKDLYTNSVVCPEEKGIYFIPITLNCNEKKSEVFAYNFWMDGAVIDDYYRHKWYKYPLDQDLGLLFT